MKTKICSFKHFERLCKSFNKKFYIEITANKHLEKYKENLKMFYYNEEGESKFSYSLRKLKKSFKHNPYKTCSGFKSYKRFLDEKWDGKDANLWVSYTIEDEKFKRIKDNNFKDKFITFRVFMKIENQRKKRIYRWRVKINWIN